jgi:hypothetical protein
MIEIYEKALRNLEKVGSELQIVTEEDASAFVDKLATEIEVHEQIDLV